MATKAQKSINNPEHGGENVLPSEFSEILEGVPEVQKRQITRVMEAQFSMISRVSPEMEVSKKITSDHITTMLDNQSKAMDLQHKDQWQKMVFYGVVVFFLLVAVFGIIYLLKDTPDTMERILTVIVTAVITGLGGYGIGYKKGSSD